MHRSFNLLLLGIAGLLSCEAETAREQELPLESFRKEVEATQVRVARSERSSFDYLVNASGKVEARDQIKIVVERSGYLTDLPVKEGDKVQAGQLLARLDPSEREWLREERYRRLKL